MRRSTNFLVSCILVFVLQSSVDAVEVGPGSAIANSLVMTANGSTLYAATASNGVWKRDLFLGTPWVQASSGLESLFVEDLVVDPNNDSVLYAATLGGLFKSSNGGASWSRLTYDRCRAVTVDPNDSHRVLVGTFGGGVRISNDSGLSFVSSMSGLTDLHVQAIAVDSVTGNILIGTERAGVFKSTNGGATWTQVNTGIGDPVPGTSENENLNISAIAFQPDTPNIWLGTSYPSIVGRAFKSTNGGSSWNEQTIGAGGDNSEGVTYFAFFDQNVFYIGTRNGVIFTTNGGASFNNFSYGTGVFAEIHSIAVAPPSVDPTGGTLYVGLLGLGVLKSTNATGSWNDFSGGLRANRVNTLVVSSNGSLAAGIEEGGVYLSSNGSSWNGGFAPNPDGTAQNGLDFEPHRGTFTVLSLAFSPCAPSIIYAGAKRFGIWKSVNGGTTWSKAAGLHDIYALAGDPTDPAVFYAASFVYGIVKTEDNGASFTPIFNDFPAKSLTINPDVPTEVLAGTFDFGVCRTTDEGLSWANQAVDHQGFSRTTFFSIAHDPNDAGRVMAGTNKGLFVSNDLGSNWSLKTNAIPHNIVTKVLFHPAVVDRIYAGTYDGGVFVSSDGGSGWTQVSGTEGLTVLDMVIYSGNLYVATPQGITRP